MLLRKIPKRSIIAYPGELKDILLFAFSNPLNEGNFIEKFEYGFKEYIGAEEAIAVCSGRFALYLIIKSLGLKKGDGIILSAYNFEGVPKILLKEGFKLQFVDADKDSYQIDAEKIEQKIDSSTKVIIATHLFGQPCNLDKILEIAQRHNLFVVEDAAHSLGTSYQGRPTGAITDAGFFSFTGSKILNTSFGGMVVTNDAALADKIRKEVMLYNFPRRRELIKEVAKKYIYTLLTKRTFYTLMEYPLTLLMSFFDYDPLEAYKSIRKSEITDEKLKFTNLQAFIGTMQLDFVKKMIEKRKRIAQSLIREITPIMSLQEVPPQSSPNYFMFPISTKDKLRVFKKLLLKGIDSNLKYASDCSYLAENTYMPVAQLLSDTILTISLPFDLKEKEVFYIAEVLSSIRDRLN
ncbi:MAG: aminotransferase class I/II-fold pyridoxal phosphate-dependent enzyme [Candidatus Omnitrophica bacterium]|nr:aminotransferase class I/II-fold pyridoxal phosphate-dependent enzyme [Candidatus Omnitrophota bacterium]